MKNLPREVICVDRPSRWGNPFYIDTYRSVPWSTLHLAGRLKVRVKQFRCTSKAEATEKFREWLLAGRLEITPDEIKAELRGKTLACFDRDHQPSHADVLIEVANQ